MKKIFVILLVFTIFLISGCGGEEFSNSLGNSSKSKSVKPSILQSKTESLSEQISQSSMSGLGEKSSTVTSENGDSLGGESSQKSLNKSINSQNSQSSAENSSSQSIESEPPVLGVWWWSDSLDDSYYNFVISRGVNEIYYCASDFSTQTYNFIKRANQNGVKVYWLAGEYEWAENSENLYKKLNLFLQYQNAYPDGKFAGVHLDIEPHQNPKWKGTTKESPIRITLVQQLIDLAVKVKADFPLLNVSYDLPFWLDYEIKLNGETKIAYEAMIDVADKVFLMSYRDTADGIYSVSSQEIEYAKKVNKSVYLGIETYSSEGDNVSFWEEGEAVMLSEMDKLRDMVDKNFGLSVHHAKKWVELANKTVE